MNRPLSRFAALRVLALFLLLSGGGAPGQAQEAALSTLDEIWDAMWKASAQLEAASADLSASVAGEGLVRGSYLPTIKASSYRSYNMTSPSSSGDWLGDWNTDVGVEQPFPGGGSVSTGISDSITEAAFVGGIADIHFPTAYLEITQGLDPFWLRPGTGDPVIEAASIARRQAEVTVRKVRRDLAVQAAEYYIRLRQLEREIAILSDSIAFDEEMQHLRETLRTQGTITMSDVWKSQTALWQKKHKLIEAQAQAAELVENLYGLVHARVGETSGRALPALIDARDLVPSVEEAAYSLSLRDEGRKLVEGLQRGAPQVSVRFSRSLVIRPAGWDSSYDSAYSIASKDTWTLSLLVMVPAGWIERARLDREIAAAHEAGYTALMAAEREKVASRRRVVTVRLEGIRNQLLSLQEELTHAGEMEQAIKTQIASGQLPEYQGRDAELITRQIGNDIAGLADQEWLNRFYLAILSGWEQ